MYNAPLRSGSLRDGRGGVAVLLGERLGLARLLLPDLPEVRAEVRQGLVGALSELVHLHLRAQR